MNMFIRKLSSLGALDAGAIAAVGALTSRPRTYVARQDLIREGDPPGPVFVVLGGWVCRYKILPDGRRQIIAFLIPGDTCDLNTDMIEQMDHSIQAVTSATIATIARSDMDELMSSHSDVNKAMHTAQLISESISRSWIVSMGRRSSIERIAHLTCELYVRLREVGHGEEGDVQLPLSQNVLADALGLTSVHINRMLKELKDLNVMALSRGRLEILDPSAIVQIAGFDANYLHRRGARIKDLLA